MGTLRKTILRSVLFLIASVPLALGRGTYTQIDEPDGVNGTYVQSVDGAGDIVGYYADASFITHGFLLSGGTYTTIDYPGSQQTLLYGVNDVGQIVGFSAYPPPIVGFLFDVSTQMFTTISYPRATDTYPLAINDAGTIAGYFTYGNGSASGFESAGSTYRQIKPPQASNSFVYGISTSGELAGHVASINQGNVNFLFKQGTYSPISIPNAPSAVILGINPAGTALVGYYLPSPEIFVGFLYQNKTTQTLQFPGAVDTAAFAINAAGEIVGVFYDSLGTPHGFLWTPPGDAAKK